MGIVEAMDPEIETSSDVPLPRVTAPFKVAAPSTSSASMARDFVLSVSALMRSLKFWLTWVASAEVPLLNVYVTDGRAITHPLVWL